MGFVWCGIRALVVNCAVRVCAVGSSQMAVAVGLWVACGAGNGTEGARVLRGGLVVVRMPAWCGLGLGPRGQRPLDAEGGRRRATAGKGKHANVPWNAVQGTTSIQRCIRCQTPAIPCSMVTGCWVMGEEERTRMERTHGAVTVELIEVRDLRVRFCSVHVQYLYAQVYISDLDSSWYPVAMSGPAK